MNDNHSESDNMSYRNALIHNLLLKSHRFSLDQNRKSFDWLLRKQILQEQHNSLRTNLLMSVYNPIVSSLDPNYCLLLETGFRLRTQTISSLTYHDSMQQIQDQESLLLTPLRGMTNTSSSPLTAQSLYTSPLLIDIPHDIALDNDEDKNGKLCPDPKTNTGNRRDPTHSFPCQLHKILSNPEYSECITWLPHGRAWRILRRTQFERHVIPRHFRHGRYASFMRQVNGWGFQRITEGPDHNAYLHPQFMKDSPHLCLTMRRPLSLDISRSHMSPCHWNEDHKMTEQLL